MFSNDKNIDTLQQLIKEVKQYIELQKDYVRIDLVEKLSILIFNFLLILFLGILIIISLFYLSFSLVYILEPHFGFIESYAMVAGGFILLTILIAIFRKQLIMKPLVNFLTKLLLNDE